MNSSSNITTVIGTSHDIDTILELTNDAFMADAFFKKPEYHQRFIASQVYTMIHTDRSMFFIAKSSNVDVMIGDEKIEKECGSLYFHWDSTLIDNVLQICGKFSAVSVPTKYGGKGIGKALVKAAEDKLLEIARCQWDGVFHPKHIDSSSMSLEVVMEMGVINQRTDLFPWYEKQGYKVIHEIRPNEEELLRVCLDELSEDVCCVLMRKVLLLS